MLETRRNNELTTMTTQVYTVHCRWDPEAGVWIATSDDVPGLVAEADTMEKLTEDVKLLVPDLLELNCGIRGPAEVSLVVTSRREERVRLPAA
jgi:hypothetical protein